MHITQVHMVHCLLQPMHVSTLLTEAFVAAHIRLSLQGMQAARLFAGKGGKKLLYAASSFVAAQTLSAAHSSAALHCRTLHLAALCQAWLPVPLLV